MKRYKVKASYVVHCEAEIEAPNEATAYEIALGMDGGAFDEIGWPTDWVINTIDEIGETK